MPVRLSVKLTDVNDDWVGEMIGREVFQSKNHAVNFSLTTLRRIYKEKPELLEWLHARPQS